MASWINPFDAAQLAQKYSDPTKYIQGGSVDYPGGSSPLNPSQFATPEEAARLAALYKGTASGQQLSGPGYGYTGPGGPIEQQQLNIPGAPSPLNAGLVSSALGQYPGGAKGYGGFEVARDVAGNYGPSPFDTVINPSAIGMRKGYEDMSNPTPVVGAGDVKASQANYLAYHPTAQAPGAAKPPAGPGGVPTAPPTGPGAIQRPAPAGPGTPVTPPRDRIPTTTNQFNPQSANVLRSRGGLDLPNQGTDAPADRAPFGFGNTDPTGDARRAAAYQEAGWTQGPNGQWLNPEAIGGEGGTIPGGDLNQPPPDNTPPYIPPPYFPPPGGQQGPGFPPSGGGYAPNSQYQLPNQFGSPQATNPYGYPGAVGPYLTDPSGKGENLQYKTENDRAMAIQQGLGLSYDLINQTNLQQNRANAYEGAANSAYGGIASGYGGYTDPEKSAIQQQPALNAMQLSTEQQNQNFLTPQEQGDLHWVKDPDSDPNNPTYHQEGTAGITGDPYAPYRQLGLDEQSIDASTLGRNAAVRGAYGAGAAGIDSGLSGTTSAVRNSIYDDQSKQYQNLSDAAALTRGAVDTGTSNVRGALNYGEDTTRSYIDPSKLGLSNEYNQNYNFGEGDIQALKDQAGRAVSSQEAMDTERLLAGANAQGNVSPLAIAAARAKIRQQSAVNQANAASDAAIQGRRLQLDTTQQKENTRLGAEGNIANLGTGTELALGGRRTAAEQALGAENLSNEQYLTGQTLGTQNTLAAAQLGAEQYLGSQKQQAEQFKTATNVGAEQALGEAATGAEKFKTSTNLGAGQTAEQAASNRAAQIAQNRQATNVGNQASTLARQQYAYGNTAANNTNFANQRLGQEQEYRGYLTGQGTQATQAAQVGTQQRIGAYGTQLGAQNAATGNAITNYKVPGALEKTLGHFAKGGVEHGPIEALVGEAGPELIIDLPKRYGGGGYVDGGYDPNDYYSQMYGQSGPDIGSGETGYEGNTLPTSVAGTQVKRGQDLPVNPLYATLRRGLYAPSQPQGQYPSDNSQGAGQGLGKQLTSSLLQAGLKYLLPAAGGATVSGPKQHHFYGSRKNLHTPHAQLVTHPQIRTLGGYGAQAVVPLTHRKSNNLNVSDIPKLMHGGYGR